MPKMRTRSSAKKRFSVTANRKIKREKAYASHILTKKTTKRKRNLRKPDLVSPTQVHRVKKMLCI
jgi:large subunit ribosomal protein L35